MPDTRDTARRSASKRERRRARLEAAILSLASPASHRTPATGDAIEYHTSMEEVLGELEAEAATPQPRPELDFDAMPFQLSMTYGATLYKPDQPRKARQRDAARIERKNLQVTAFHAAIASLHLPSGSTVVDFGRK